jgi:hypothetical protein
MANSDRDRVYGGAGGEQGGAGREWGAGYAGGYGRSREYGHDEGRVPRGQESGRSPGADPAATPGRGRYAGIGPRGWRRADDDIREDVCETLARDSWVDASDIEVRVEGGTVTLEGTVPDRDTRWRAEDLLDRVAGVSEVRNQLRVARAGRGGGRETGRETGRESGRPTGRD